MDSWCIIKTYYHHTGDGSDPGGDPIRKSAGSKPLGSDWISKFEKRAEEALVSALLAAECKTSLKAEVRKLSKQKLYFGYIISRWKTVYDKTFCKNQCFYDGFRYM